MNAINSPINPVEIYDRYLKLLSDEKSIIREADLKERYAASGAGLCKRKQWYAYNDYNKNEIDSDSIRKMRLGTLVGQDFDSAIKWFRTEKLLAQIPGDDLSVLIEHPVQSNDFKLLGHFDLLIIQDRKGYLYDYKTCHEFTFRKETGKLLSKSNEKDNYAYQLGTYGFLIERDDRIPCDEVVYMANIYINKNDSKVKNKEINLNYKDLAMDYWLSVNDNQRKEEPPPFGLNNFTPTYKWECGDYCSFRDDCNSPYKKKVN